MLSMWNNMTRQTITRICISLLLIISITTYAWADEHAAELKSTQLTWEELEGILRYDVTIKDATGAVVLKKSVETSKIEFSLPPGSYQINIISINIFGKKHSDSGWDTFTIKFKKVKKREKVKSTNAQSLLGIGLKISIGCYYMMPMENWKNYYHDSYTCALFRMSLNFGNLGVLKKYSFFKHIGLELDSSYTGFTGKKRYGKMPFDSHIIPVGGNMFFTTGSSVPINLIIRFGGGAAFTLFEYYNTFTNQEYNLWSTDPYFLGGLSIEITYYKYLYFELGADFIYIDYIGKHFSGLRYFFMAGIRL